MKLIMALSPGRGLPELTNVLAIRCDCGCDFAWPSRISTAECPSCGRAELWHGVDPKPASGWWSGPEMDQVDWHKIEDVLLA